MFIKSKLRNSLNFFSDTLNSVDIFEDPVQLNVRGKTTTTSSLGGIISLAIIAFLASQAIIQTVGMFNRDSPQVIQVNEFQNDPGRVSMDQANNFLFSISSRIGNDFINISNNSRLSFVATYSQRIVSAELELIKYEGKVLWAPCSRSNFANDAFLPNTFEAYYLAYAYCATGINFTNLKTGVCPAAILKDHPDCIAPPDFELQGTMFSMNYNTIDFQVKICDPNDSVYIKGLKCSTDPKNEILNATGVHFYLGFSNNYVDPSNYGTSNTTFFDFIEWNLHPDLPRTADLYVDMETVQDFDNFFSSNSYRESSFYSISADKMREQQVSTNNFLLATTIQRSKLNRVTSRSYVKILDVISNVGGLSELFIFIGAVIALGYARYKYYMVVSNELYDLDPLEQIKKRVTPENIGNNSSLEKSDQKEMSFNQSVSRTLVPMRSQPKDEKSIKDYFDSETKKKKKMEYNEFRYYKDIFGKFCGKRSPEERIAERARETALRDLDVIKIIEKLREIDKLKLLLLNKNQLMAFNFVKKPLVKLKNANLISRDHLKALSTLSSPQIPGNNLDLFSQNEKEEEDLEKLYLAYKQIKADSNPENNKYNEIILSMLGEETVRIFDEFERKRAVENDSKSFEKLMKGL